MKRLNIRATVNFAIDVKDEKEVIDGIKSDIVSDLDDAVKAVMESAECSEQGKLVGGVTCTWDDGLSGTVAA